MNHLDHRAPTTDHVTLRALVLYFARLGTTGFGGPIALAGAMQRDLVDERGWFTRDEYLRGLALAQLAPGPLAAQLAIYLGWARGGVLGATLVGLAFVLPSLLMVLALSALYVRFAAVSSFIAGAFYGIGAAVIAVITRSAYKLVKMTLARDEFLWAIFIVNAIATAITERELLTLIVASGLIIVAIRVADRRRATAASTLLAQIFWFFAKAGAFVFGSGLAIVPFLYGGVVEQYHWLNDRQFLDAVAVAMITPGPVVITVAFIGYLVAGVPGALVAALGVFAPCYLFVIIPAPYYHRIAENKTIRAFVDGVTAAATGAIAGAAFVLGKRALIDITAIAIALVTLLVMMRFKRVPEPVVILAAGALGLLLS
ncbi:MAG TPA: chromate efflux transporter [Thermoanaerobaculia bacterium]|nr:chromate efflux transporter [Thermoanaerobaculia bacterium]